MRARLLEQYLAAIAGTDPDGSLLEVRYRRRNGGMRQRFYPAASDLASTASLIIELGARTDVYVGAAPRSCRHGGRAAIEKVWCLWVDCDGPEAVTALGRFAPAPAIVVSSGSAANVHAYWPLRTPIGPQEAEVANRRLAHAVTADPASTEPARILRPARATTNTTPPPRWSSCASPADALASTSSSAASMIPPGRSL